jgi:hypothetical protein
MIFSKDVLINRLRLKEYPRSATYDPEWVLENLMGPNVLWLAEALSQVMDLQPGMRVLDMAIGAFTDRHGGSTIGKRLERSMLHMPICCQTVGGSGFCGSRSAARQATRLTSKS